MAWTLGRFGIGVALIAILSCALALVQNRVLWGFWFTRPTLTEELVGAIELRGVSGLRFDDSGFPVPSSTTRSTLLELAPKVCNKRNVDRGYYCLEHRLLVWLVDSFGPLDRFPDVESALLTAVWKQYRSEGWHPSTDPGYQGIPHIGLALHFRRDSQEHVILAYETLEVAGDRYAYAEALYRLNEPSPVLLREHRLFYEVAGAEAWGTPVLAAINALLLLPGSVFVALGGRRLTLLARAGVVVGSLGLLTAGLWLLSQTYWGRGADAVVPLIWASLLGGPALLAIGTVVRKSCGRSSISTTSS